MAKNDNFVDQLITDPNNIPDLVLLNGFEGKSAKEGHTRLYLNAVLNEYYEIPSDAVLLALDAPASAGNPLPTRYLWVKGDAALIRQGKGSTARTVQFLSGPIQSAQAAAPAPAAPAA